MNHDARGFWDGVIGDGRSLIALTAVCLGLSGGFAIFQSATRHFLPHDIEFLGMSAEELCGLNECRIVHFMFHDRVSFGGALLAIAVLYLWLAEFPLKAREAWAWWALSLSGVTGFGSFLTYLGYGYLDTWHGVATLFLLPCFVGGLWKTRPVEASSKRDPQIESAPPRSLFLPPHVSSWNSREGIARALLLAVAIGTIGAGFTIQTIGMTKVFVDTDLEFMGITKAELRAINPRLIPLIAHDRAGFGGGVATAGLLTFASVWFAANTRSFRQALLLAGFFGWSTAIFIHPVIGYNNTLHLTPAVLGATGFFLGVAILTSARNDRALSI